IACSHNSDIKRLIQSHCKQHVSFPIEENQMLQRRSLTQLANNPELIDGIYNYCDRWCERCPFTSRCLVYASETDEEVCQTEQDVANAAFWRELDSVLQETLLLIPEWATASGFDLTSLEDTSRKRKRQQVDNHPLVLTA